MILSVVIALDQSSDVSFFSLFDEQDPTNKIEKTIINLVILFIKIQILQRSLKINNKKGDSKKPPFFLISNLN
tara:strand:+ start:396 stop:614 length:219 start_codon:yes stop_codon:yes gene_type:complete